LNFLLNIKEALQSLNANKTRSLLTILGIVIGVASVIALLSLGEGAGNSITGEIESIGTNVIYILNGNTNEEVTNPKELTLRDAQVLSSSRRATAIAYVAPVFSRSSEITHSGNSKETAILGSTPDYQFVQNLTMAEGEFISEAQVEGRSAVVVLGPEIATYLLGRNTNIVGNTVRIGGYPYRIVGVTEAKGGSAFNNPDNNVYIPISTAQARLPHDNSIGQVQYILVSAVDAESADLAIQQIREVLRMTHRIPPRNPDDFTILNQQDFLAVAASITNVLTIVPGGHWRNLTAGGWDWDYEYHARICDRTYPGDWFAQSAGCAQERHFAAIPDRVCSVIIDRWADWDRPGVGDIGCGGADCS